MTGKIKLTDSAPGFPVVVAEETTVLVQWDGMGFRCSADAAHALSDALFQAALAVEGRLVASEDPGPE